MIYFWPKGMSLDGTIKAMLALGKGLEVEKIELTNASGLFNMGGLLDLTSNN